MNTVVQFWLLFFLANSLFFVPRYLLEMFHSQFFPIRAFTTGPPGMRLRSLLIRLNYDPFRISSDFLLLILLYVVILRDVVPLSVYFVFLVAGYGLALMYQCYYQAFHKIYHLDPVFFHDGLMLKTAGQIFIHEFSKKNLIMVCVALLTGAAATLCLWALMQVASVVHVGTGSAIFSGVLCAGALYSLKYAYSKYPQLTFQSQLQSFIRNLRISRRSKASVAGLTLQYMKTFNVEPSVQLESKPDVYILVIESYGRMALESEGLKEQFNSYAPQLEERLTSAGWSVRSCYTLSPVTGGASWISYTSILYGLNVRNQGVYRTMLKNTYMPGYDSLFHWLKRQGYATFRISSLGGYETMEIPYDSYSRLYGIDHWIKYKDLDYRGLHYGFGPSPPDQYALWKGDTLADEQCDGQPKAVFFITQNSHTPYESPLHAAEDWRTLSDEREHEPKESLFWSRPKFEKYGDAIAYQLDMVTDFIAKHEKDNAVFIVVGDHQPPSLSRSVVSFDTPLHVIAKNSAFLEAWSEYGLIPGIVPDTELPAMRQEALHWALLRALIRTYGSQGAKLPDYLPQGIPY